MRTTLQINDTLLDAVRREAMDRHCSLGDVVDEALRKVLASRSKAAPRSRTALPVFRGNGVQPGVDLDNSGGLLDRMEAL